MLSLMIFEHLKVTTRLASIIMSSPVWGFLPFRSFLSFTQNFPKPLTRKSSPDTNVRLMISSKDSTTAEDSCFAKSVVLQTEFIRLAFS
jgi:hypothetical protein